jgi:MFS family permease
VAALGDRFARSRVLLGTYLAQALLMAATAIAIEAGSLPLIIYALATVCATLVSTSRPVHAALMPEVVASPDDLTAANVVSGMGESAGSLIGPLGAGILIGLAGPAEVFAVSAVCNLLASLAILPVVRQLAARRRAAAALLAASPSPAPEPTERAARRGWRDIVREEAGGLSAIWADRRLRAVVAIATWATFLVGSMDILYAVLALDLLDLSEGGVGFVGAVGGGGAILGSAAGLLLVGRERLGLALAASAILYGVAISAIAIAPGPLAAGLLLVAGGVGSGLTSVGAQTLIQRLAGDDVMSRVFGVLQGLMMGAVAFGALVVPVVIGLVGDRAVFAFAGLSLPLVILVVGRTVILGDRLHPERAAELRLLRSVPMLSPLSGPVLERLAGGIVRIEHPAGSTIVREGDQGERFFVVASGTLEVRVAGREIRRLGPGDGFGEIALLRDVPRTATVSAVDDVTLLGIDREPFIEALGGQPRSRTIAAVLVDDRLASDGARS